MILFGIDYGGKRIGLAVAREGIAFPRGVVENSRQILHDIILLIKEEQADLVIVGDTLSFGNHRNSVSDQLDAFVEELRRRVGVPVVLGWEAGSTVEAGRYAPDDEQHNDAAAAAVILQRYIDMHPHSV